jgi:OmpA-OmpF porin, OOP family
VGALFCGVFAAPPALAQDASKNSDGAYTPPQKLNPKAVRITIYRADQGASQGVARLTINGRYHAALQRGKYTDLCMLPSEITMTAHIVQASDTAENQKYGLSLRTKAGESYFASIDENAHHIAVISPVGKEKALIDLQNMRRQALVTSRVPGLLDCEEEAAAVAPTAPVATPVAPVQAATAAQIKIQETVLSTDSVFGFGKSDVKSITGEGREALDQLIASLQRQYGSLDKVKATVVGHSDLMGSPSANLHLSQARAQAVREYLIKGGLNPDKLGSDGHGDREPVVANCDKTINLENIECNKPNRRVVVAVQALDR